MSKLLQKLYAYHAWANNDLFTKLKTLDKDKYSAHLRTTTRLLNHSYIVSRIFSAHLVDRKHGYTSDNTEETPDLNKLHADTSASDLWYLDYVGAVSPETLAEAISFRFTDGDMGSMTRVEMLIHVAMHAGYHRGEIGRMLSRLDVIPPRDTFAVYLHQSEPARRQADDKLRA